MMKKIKKNSSDKKKSPKVKGGEFVSITGGKPIFVDNKVTRR
jgi:hypothetical protein